MRPPWKVEPEVTLSCHRKEKHIAVKTDHPQLTSDPDHVQEYDGGRY
jgi:hypothetical protein